MADADALAHLAAAFLCPWSVAEGLHGGPGHVLFLCSSSIPSCTASALEELYVQPSSLVLDQPTSGATTEVEQKALTVSGMCVMLML